MKFLFTLLLLISTTAFAQEAAAPLSSALVPQELVQSETSEADTSTVAASPWTHQLAAGVNINQAQTSSNWHTGATDMWSWIARIDGKTQYETDQYIWFWMVDLKYGKSKTNDEPMIKFADKILTETVGAKKLSPIFNAYTGLKFESQFDAGFGSYQYPGKDSVHNQKVSNFLNPGYITHSIGLGYNPDPMFSQRLGYATKFTFASEHRRRYADDIETSEIETLRIEPGLESISEFNYAFHEMAHFKSILRIFANFDGIETTDASWDNTLTASVTEYLELSLSYALLYDIDLDTSYQRNQTLGLGLTWNMF